ncbi:MAG: hypothetical protein M1819_000564 [Sarea resinae]|nr:MAG: hypothetical protein M1819_000564 [Sarea resinae]
MNGSQDGAMAPQVNGNRRGGEDSSLSSQRALAGIIEALQAVHSPLSTNETRKEASLYLDRARADVQAPYNGFTLATDKSQASVVRHFALSLIEYAIKYRWAEYSPEQSAAIREWVLILAQKTATEDPLYIRNKLVQLWVEVAKRSWALDWLDMDELLVQLWDGSLVQKELVLSILETLSEDIFNSEDPTVGIRGGDLNKACVEIFTPAAVLAERFPSRDTSLKVRCGDESWLARMTDLLAWCIDHNVEADQSVRGCAVKTLRTIRSVVGWVIPKAVSQVHCVDYICRIMGTSSVPVHLASVEVLHALYSRGDFESEDFLALVCPMYQGQNVALLQNLYTWSCVETSDIDESKYLVLQRLSEMISNLGNFIERRPLEIPADSDLPNFLNLCFDILRNQSLIVSIPLLHTWSKLLGSDTISESDAIAPLVGPLLGICSERLFRYEALPDESEDPTIVFLNEDIDTIPERHAFLGNYRRYCVRVVETIVKRKPFEAMSQILGQVDQVLQSLYDGQPPFQIESYNKNSVPNLRVDAHFTVVEAALNGYVKWVTGHGSRPQQDEKQRNLMEVHLERWCQHVLEMRFQDPLIQKRIIEVVVEFSIKALKKKTGFTSLLIEQILLNNPGDTPSYYMYSEAVKELQSVCVHALHRLALNFPDYFYSIYSELEAKINQLITASSTDPRQALSYETFLFLIIHRTSLIGPELRESQLERFLLPIRSAWQDPELTQSLSSYKSFCELLGLSKVQDYLINRQAYQIPDWSSVQVDDEGRAMQVEMNERLHKLPLRPTKSFITVSVDRTNSASHRVSCVLWRQLMPTILPNLLQLITHSHAFHNVANWPGLPEEMQPIVGRVLTDRFWQAGISTGSRDDFFERLNTTKSSLEGFASSVRSTIRSVRETCYSIIYAMTLLGEDFYGFKELPGPLAQALFADAHTMSPHQLSALLKVARYIIDGCPPALRQQFLPPILAALFSQVDTKISAEWEKITQQDQASSEEESLGEEMRNESILRQITHAAVSLVAGLLYPERENMDSTSSPNGITMRILILSDPSILEPLILFCTHALQMRDSRCCTIIIKVFRIIIPEFTADSPIAASIRDFISNEVLKACITSIHEPYFVDLQKDLAQLIATIVILYSPRTDIPKQILLSLPGQNETKVDTAISRLLKSQVAPRVQRAIVLDLLAGLRGVRISEQGKFASPDPKKVRSAMQERYMNVEVGQSKEQRGGSPDLGGIADMFG